MSWFIIIPFYRPYGSKILRTCPSLLLFSHEVVSNSLWPHGLQHVRLLSTPLSPRVCSNSSTLSLWCYLTISSSASPTLFCLQSSSASGSFLVSLLFTSGGQELELQWQSFQWIFRVDFPYDCLVWSPCNQRNSQRVFSSTTIWKHQSFGVQPSFMVQLSHPSMTPGKTIALTIQTFVSKMKSLLLIGFGGGGVSAF